MAFLSTRSKNAFLFLYLGSFHLSRLKITANSYFFSRYASLIGTYGKPRCAEALSLRWNIHGSCNSAGTLYWRFRPSLDSMFRPR